MPTVTGQTPAPGSALLPTTPIAFTVSGISGAYGLTAYYQDGQLEVIWDGFVFAPFFLLNSTVSPLSAGAQDFSVLRTGGWSKAPTIILSAATGSGAVLVPVATLNDLKNIVPGTTGTVYAMAGRGSIGDGGGGHFAWVAGDSTTDDGGTVIQSTDAPSAGRFKRVFSGPLDVRWFGAKGDKVTDNVAAIRAAYVAAKKALSLQGDTVGGAVIDLPPGIYRMSSPLIVDGSVTIRGRKGSTLWGSSVLQFDENINAPALVDVLQNATDGTGTVGQGTRIEDVVIAQAFSSARNYQIATVGIRISASFACIRDVYVSTIQGDGIEINGGTAIADHAVFEGSCHINGCDRYGLRVHGGDGNACSSNNIDIRSCGSWGVYDSSQLGNGWGPFHTSGNGYTVQSSAWVHAGNLVSAANVWAASTVTTAGKLMLPTVAHRSGYQYRAISVTSDAQTGGSEPTWPTSIGATVVDNHVTWLCYAEEGGPIWSADGGGNSAKAFYWPYMESDQNRMRFDSGFDFIVGGPLGSGWDVTSRVLFGPSFGKLVPFDVYTQRTAAFDSGAVARPFKLSVGDQSDPYVAFSKAPFPETIYSGSIPALTLPKSYTAGVTEFRDKWDFDGALGAQYRWVRQAWTAPSFWGFTPAFYGLWSYTECDGRDGPQQGAVCWPSLWVAGVVGSEKRITAFQATVPGASPYTASVPDMTGACGSGKGAFQLNDVVINAAASGRPSVPLMWRAKSNGGVKQNVNTWRAGQFYVAGTILSPGTAGSPLYRARNGGMTGNVQPAFVNTPGTSYVDGPYPGTPVEDLVNWDYWGTESDTTFWEPVHCELPTPISIDVSANGGGSRTLTEDEAAHAQVHIIGAPSGNVTVLVPPGAALAWSRVFFDDTTGGHTITISHGSTLTIDSSTDTGTALTVGGHKRLYSNGKKVQAE